MTDAPSWRDFIFPTPPQTTAGTQYALVVTGSVAGVAYWRHTSPPAGANQEMWKAMPGGSWFADSTYGYAFRTYVFQGATLQWSAASIVAGKSTTLTLTETYKFDLFAVPTQVGALPNAPGPYYVEQVALPSWFAVGTAVCSSQITSPCTPAAFVPNAIFSVTPDGNPVTITLTGTASPPAGAAGTKGTASGETCFNPTGIAICLAGSGEISILAPGATAPPTATEGGVGDASSGTTLWLLPAALMALLGATFVWRRRTHLVR